MGAPGGALESKNVNISVHVEQKGVLGGGSGNAPESENGSSSGVLGVVARTPGPSAHTMRIPCAYRAHTKTVPSELGGVWGARGGSPVVQSGRAVTRAL